MKYVNPPKFQHKRVYAALILSIALFAGGCEQPPAKDYLTLGDMADPQQVYSGVFGQGEICDIYVTLKNGAWESLLAGAIKEEYYPADIRVNGIELKNVGFRTKGGSSLMTVAQSKGSRFGFKIKTDEYEDGQTLEGLDMLVLNPSFGDPSYMREFLTYAASLYLDCITPFVSFTRLYINGELHGFYLMVEAYDDSFVERYTPDQNAVLYKASSESCTLTVKDDASGFSTSYGKDKNNTRVQNFIKNLNNAQSKEDFEAVLDVQSVLKSIAINTVLGNYDSYSGPKAHNYYLLCSSGVFSYIGWDYNMSAGGFGEDGGASVSVDVSSPFYNAAAQERPLFSRLLAVEDYYNQYISYVKKLCDYFEDIESYTGLIDKQIGDCVQQDPSAFYTFEQYKANIVIGDGAEDQFRAPQGTRVPPMKPPAGQRPPFEGGENHGAGGAILDTCSVAGYISRRVTFIMDNL